MSASKYIDSPLTSEEQLFATEHHGIVISYLIKHRLNFDEWYDIIIMRYLLSVKRWFDIPALHRYSFCTIAYNAMRSAVGCEYKKLNCKKRKAVLISLDDPAQGFFNEDGECPTLGDALADINSNFTCKYDYISIAETSKH